MSDYLNVNEKMPPNLKEILDDHAAKIYAGLNCVNIGRVEKVNASEQTVEVTLQIKRLAADGTSTAWPLLVDCPYFVLQGGGAYIDMPIKSGDYCLVLFNDRNIDTWWSTANMTDPRTSRKHSMSDGIALVGLNPKPQALASSGTKVRVVGTSGPSAVKDAARKGDAVQSLMADDSVFWTWIAAAGAALAALGVTAPIPTALTGKITGGSTEVQIG